MSKVAHNRIDLVGQTFGDLKVICSATTKVSPSGSHAAMWLVECICGDRADVSGSDLRRGHTKGLRKCSCSLTGKTFGDLTFGERVCAGDHASRSRYSVSCGHGHIFETSYRKNLKCLECIHAQQIEQRIAVEALEMQNLRDALGHRGDISMKKTSYTGYTLQDLAEKQSARLHNKGDKASTEDFLLTLRTIEGLLTAACAQGAPPMLHIVGHDAVVLSEAAQPLTLEEEQAATKAVQDLRTQQEKNK